MDAPPIQYVRTEDGVNIAYWTLGHGPTLIHGMMPAGSHVELEWSVPSVRAWYEHLAEQFTIVRFDHRGRGLSDRDMSDLSMAAHLRDIDAISTVVAGDRFALLATHFPGPAMIAFAATHSDRVTGLILLNAWPAVEPYPQLVAMSRAANSLETASRETWANQMTFLTTGGAVDETVVNLFNEALDRGAIARSVEAGFGMDASTSLAKIGCPTLVLQSRGMAFTLDPARVMAAEIPDAKLVVLDGNGSPPFAVDQNDAALAAIDAFLEATIGEDREPTIAWTAGLFRTILFTDVEASTALTDRFGDAKARDLLREHERLTRDALAAHDGTEIKTMGDGFMASFTSASSALDAAIAMQQAITAYFAESETPIRIRVGINAGEPIEEDDDLYGASVIRAARVMGQAEGGEILVTNVVRELVEGKDYLFSQCGEYDLKGFEEAVRLFEVSWRSAT